MVFLVYCGAAYSNQTSTVYDIFMNFFVIPREIQEINKQGLKISCKNQFCKNHEKVDAPPPSFILNLRVHLQGFHGVFKPSQPQACHIWRIAEFF